MWDMILTITKDRQRYAKMSLPRDYNAAVAQAKDIAKRFPESEGFKVSLHRCESVGEPIKFQDIDKTLP